MTAVSKNVYFDVLDDIVKNYSNAFHKTIKMKPIDVKYDSYTIRMLILMKKILTFKIGDRARISKCKNIFAKGHTPNWSEEDFTISKMKRTVPWSFY